MPRDASATKARIFEAASNEFALHGVAGARIDRIAESAKANKAQIYDYFGNKEQLFEHVLEEELNRLITEISTPDDHAEISEFVGRAFDYHQAHPNLVRLLHWEALHFGTTTIPGEAARRRFYRDKASLIGSYQDEGLIEKGFDPSHLYFILVSMATSWFGLPQIARMHIDSDPLAHQALIEHRRCIVEATRRILAPSSATPDRDDPETAQ